MEKVIFYKSRIIRGILYPCFKNARAEKKEVFGEKLANLYIFMSGRLLTYLLKIQRCYMKMKL